MKKTKEEMNEKLQAEVTNGSTDDFPEAYASGTQPDCSAPKAEEEGQEASGEKGQEASKEERKEASEGKGQEASEEEGLEASDEKGGREPSGSEGAPAPSQGAAFSQAQLAEAEQRGYLRGRNERIEELMREPSPYARQESAREAVFTDEPSRSEPMILNNPRVSIWDR